MRHMPPSPVEQVAGWRRLGNVVHHAERWRPVRFVPFCWSRDYPQVYPWRHSNWADVVCRVHHYWIGCWIPTTPIDTVDAAPWCDPSSLAWMQRLRCHYRRYQNHWEIRLPIYLHLHRCCHWLPEESRKEMSLLTPKVGYSDDSMLTRVPPVSRSYRLPTLPLLVQCLRLVRRRR